MNLFRRRFPEGNTVSDLTIAVRPEDYLASRIALAVEDCNAHLLNLNLTGERTERGWLIADLRVDLRNGETVARSLERYGFEIIGLVASNSVELDSARERANEILRILDI